jgi:hypothetical protein
MLVCHVIFHPYLPSIPQSHGNLFLRLPLAISLSRILAPLHNQILGSIIMLATQITLQNRLRAIGISLLRIQTRAGHVRDHGVSASEWVLGVAEGMIFGCGLREPDVASVAAEVARLEGLGDVFFYDDGAAGGVYKPGAWGLLAW